MYLLPGPADTNSRQVARQFLSLRFPLRGVVRTRVPVFDARVPVLLIRRHNTSFMAERNKCT